MSHETLPIPADHAFLFKELLYQEVYLASFVELNDPLDMTPVVDFRTTESQDARHLAHFLLTRLFRATQSMAAIEALRVETQFDAFAKAILREMNGVAPADGTVSSEDLFRLLKRIQDHESDDFPFVQNLEAIREDIDATIATFFNNSHVACFAEERDNFLMWSHYAGCHQGICMEFELPRQTDTECHLPLEMLGRPTAERDSVHKTCVDVFHYHATARKVAYVDTLSSVSFYEFLPVFANEGDVDLHSLSKSQWHPFADRLTEALLQKLRRWVPENEWRIVEVNFQECEAPEDRIRRYSMDALKGIVFGCRTGEDVKRRIRKIVGGKAGNVKFYDATMKDDGGILVAQAAEG